MIKTTKRFLFIFVIFWFLFSLVSGAEPGLVGIIRNSPNALPWLLMLVLIRLLDRKEIILGTVFIIAGIASTYFFKTFEDLVVFSIVSLPLLVIGIILVIGKK